MRGLCSQCLCTSHVMTTKVRARFCDITGRCRSSWALLPSVAHDTSGLCLFLGGICIGLRKSVGGKDRSGRSWRRRAFALRFPQSPSSCGASWFCRRQEGAGCPHVCGLGEARGECLCIQRVAVPKPSSVCLRSMEISASYIINAASEGAPFGVDRLEHG